MLDHMKLFGMGWSWGGYESLIVPAHPHRTATNFELKARCPHSCGARSRRRSRSPTLTPALGEN